MLITKSYIYLAMYFHLQGLSLLKQKDPILQFPVKLFDHQCGHKKDRSELTKRRYFVEETLFSNFETGVDTSNR